MDREGMETSTLISSTSNNGGVSGGVVTSAMSASIDPSNLIKQQQSQLQQSNMGPTTLTTSNQPATLLTISTRNLMTAFKSLVNEMKAKQFDTIRFAAYRTAIKLRYIQHRAFFHLLDVWNVVEAFRLAGLHHVVDFNTKIDRTKLEEMLALLYDHLNKRLPAGQQVAVESVSDILMAWLFYSFDTQGKGQLDVFTLKIVLSTIVCAKPLEKFKYHFTLLSDPFGVMVSNKFERYLHDLLMMAVGVFEGTNFAYEQSSSRFMLTGKSKRITMEDFLGRMMTEPGPQCLLWLTIYHRLSFVENVRHAVKCEGCRKESIIGFRYKCQRCHNYNLCQDCFWTGITSGGHTNQHDVKEYTTFKSQGSRNPLGASLRKSLHCGRPSSVSGGEMTSSLPEKSFPKMSCANNTPIGPPPSYVNKMVMPMFQDDMSLRTGVTGLPGDSVRLHQSNPMSTPPVRRHVFSPPPSNNSFNPYSMKTQPVMLPPTTPLLQQQQQHSSVDYINTSVLKSSLPPLSSSANPSNLHSNVSGATNIPLPSAAAAPLPQPVYPSPDSVKYVDAPDGVPSSSQLDNALDEHQCIAECAAVLAKHIGKPISSGEEDIYLKSGLPRDYALSSNPIEMVQELEKKNNEILREIQRIREEQKKTQMLSGNVASSVIPSMATGEYNYNVANVLQSPLPYGGSVMTGELTALKQHRDKLETRMGDLKENRRELMQRLESLMGTLKMSSASVCIVPGQSIQSNDSNSLSSGMLGYPNSSLLRPKEMPSPYIASRTNSLPPSNYYADNSLSAHRSLGDYAYGSMRRPPIPASGEGQDFTRIPGMDGLVPYGSSILGWTPNMVASLPPDYGHFASPPGSALTHTVYSHAGLPPSHPDILQAADQLSSRMANLVRDLHYQPHETSHYATGLEMSVPAAKAFIPRPGLSNMGQSQSTSATMGLQQEWYEATCERALEQQRQASNLLGEMELGQFEDRSMDANIQRMMQSEQRFMDELRARRRQQVVMAPQALGHQTTLKANESPNSTAFMDMYDPMSQLQVSNRLSNQVATTPPQVPPPPGTRSTSLAGYSFNDVHHSSDHSGTVQQVHTQMAYASKPTSSVSQSISEGFHE